MELKNIKSLKDELAYLEEAEGLLRAIYFCFSHYELCNILREKHFNGIELCTKLDNHFNFDDSE